MHAASIAAALWEFLNDPTGLLVAGMLGLLAILVVGDILSRHKDRRDLMRGQSRTLADPLTGSLNRAGVDTVAPRLLARAKDAEVTMVAVLDLDGFKQLNDSVGHAAGDAALRQLSAALREAVGDLGVVGRLGGDEFVVVASPLADDDAARILVDRLHAAVSGTIDHRGLAIPYSGSLGVCVSSVPPPGFHEMVSDADAAMYQAKHAGDGGPVVQHVGASPQAPPTAAASGDTADRTYTDLGAEAFRDLAAGRIGVRWTRYDAPTAPAAPAAPAAEVTPTDAATAPAVPASVVLDNVMLAELTWARHLEPGREQEALVEAARTGLAAPLLGHIIASAHAHPPGYLPLCDGLGSPTIVLPISAPASLDPRTWSLMASVVGEADSEVLLLVDDTTARLVSNRTQKSRGAGSAHPGPRPRILERRAYAPDCGDEVTTGDSSGGYRLLIDGYGTQRSLLSSLWHPQVAGIRFTSQQLRAAEHDEAAHQHLRVIASAAAAAGRVVLADTQGVPHLNTLALNLGNTCGVRILTCVSSAEHTPERTLDPSLPPTPVPCAAGKDGAR